MTQPRLPDFTASRAVLVGVAGYDHPDLPDLPAVAENLAAFRAILTDLNRSGFAEPNVTSVLDPADARAAMSPVVLAAGAATDLVLVYFAGHGLLTGDSGDLHLALGASVPEEPWTSLPFGYLARVLRRSPAAAKILLMDCCYSGRAARDLMGEAMNLAIDQVRVDGVYVMTSTSGTRTAKAPTGHQYTAFTGGLLDTMRDGVAAAGELLSMTHLYEQVRVRMRTAGWPIPEQYHHNNAGNLALVRNRASTPHPPARPSITPVAWAMLPPEEAAAVLETLTRQDANDLVRGAPATAVAAALPLLPLVYATARILALDLPAAGDVLRALPASWAADIVTRVDDELRGRMLESVIIADRQAAARIVECLSPVVLWTILDGSDSDQAGQLCDMIREVRADGADIACGDLVPADQPARARLLLGQRVRTLREAEGISAQDLSTRLGWDVTKLRRLERGGVAPSDRDLGAVMEQVPLGTSTRDAGQRDHLRRLAAACRQRLWWQAYRDLTPAHRQLAQWEDIATAIRCYTPQLVPGLLQTADYARCVLTEAYAGSPELVDQLVAFRRQRQRMALHRTWPLELEAAVHELALRNAIGSPTTMHTQVEALLHVAHRPNVIIRLYPVSAGTLIVPSPFILVERGWRQDGVWAMSEGMMTGHYVDEPDRTDGYVQIWSTIREWALDPEATCDWLRAYLAAVR